MTADERMQKTVQVNILAWMSMLSGDQETDWQVCRIQEISPMKSRLTPRKAALGLTLALFLIISNQANQRWFLCPEYWFPLRRNQGFLTQEYSVSRELIFSTISVTICAIKNEQLHCNICLIEKISLICQDLHQKRNEPLRPFQVLCKLQKLI